MNHKTEAAALLAESRAPDGGYWHTADGHVLNGEAILGHAILALIETLEAKL